MKIIKKTLPEGIESVWFNKENDQSGAKGTIGNAS
jgi:hypothetical protein